MFEKNTWLDHIIKLILFTYLNISSEIILWDFFFFAGYSYFNNCFEYGSLNNISYFTLHLLTQLHYKLLLHHPCQKQINFKNLLFVYVSIEYISFFFTGFSSLHTLTRFVCYNANTCISRTPCSISKLIRYLQLHFSHGQAGSTHIYLVLPLRYI